MQANRVAAVCFWGLVLPPCLAVEAEGSASEQELPSGLLNFAYANVLGTGAYQVGGRTVYVLNLPLSVSLPWPDTADWTMSLELPVTVGLHDFDWREVGGIEFSEQIGTLGITPGLEFVIPVRSNWLVKPYAHFGYTADLEEDDSSYVYFGGIRSLYTTNYDQFTVSLGASVTLAGQTPVSGGDSGGFGTVGLGVDLRHPLGVEWAGYPLEGSIYVIGQRFFNELGFLDLEEGDIDVEQTLEVGITFGSTRPLRILGVEFQRFGVGVIRGDGLDAISFNLGFPF